jgi:hypothetical protein
MTMNKLLAALVGVFVAAFCAPTSHAQNTQVTIEGTITSVSSLPGVIVGDKYSMVLYYNPTQAPASTLNTTANYTGFTLNAVVDDKDGNQNFSADSGEQLAVNDVAGNNFFASQPCCGSSTDAGFALVDTTGTAFKTTALPTTLNGVAGSGITNLDISFPLTLLTHGSSYIYTIALQDVNFTGTCQASFTLTQIQSNKTVTLDTAKDPTFSCGPGTIWYWTFDGKTIPDYPGPATLTRTVTYGSSKATTSTTVVIQ